MSSELWAYNWKMKIVNFKLTNCNFGICYLLYCPMRSLQVGHLSSPFRTGALHLGHRVPIVVRGENRSSGDIGFRIPLPVEGTYSTSASITSIDGARVGGTAGGIAGGTRGDSPGVVRDVPVDRSA